jgi:hypothetical protein
MYELTDATLKLGKFSLNTYVYCSYCHSAVMFTKKLLFFRCAPRGGGGVGVIQYVKNKNYIPMLG